MQNVAADGSIIDEPEPFFAALARSAEISTPYRESSPDASAVRHDIDGIGRAPAVRQIIHALHGDMPDADILSTLERLRGLVSGYGINQPEDVAAGLLEWYLSRAP